MNADELITGFLENDLDAEQSLELNRWLKASPENMHRFVAAVAFEEGIRRAVRARMNERVSQLFMPKEVECRIARPEPSFRRHPLFAAAAGWMLGLCSVSLLWAYTMPTAARTAMKAISILSESFEAPDLKPTPKFPKRANEWSGDMTLVSKNDADVEPSDGQRSVRLVATQSRKYAYAWRILDLADFPEPAEGKPLRVEVEASFNTPSTENSLIYQVRLAALSQEPTAVADVWNNEPALFQTVLQHVARNQTIKPNERGWRRVQAGIDVPPGTRSLVISLAAFSYHADPSAVEHYLDDVCVRLITSETTR